MADKVVDIRGRLPAARRRQLAPNGVIGTMLFVATEVMLFAGFISAHAIAKTTALTGWPPPNQPRLPAEATAINTVALLLSGVTLAVAYKKLVAAPAQAGRWLLATLILGTFFVGFQGFEWVNLLRDGLTVTSSTHGGFFYMIVGAHGLHAVGALLVMAYQFAQWRRKQLLPSSLLAFQVFWFFVVGMWPVIYWKVYF